MINQQTLQGNWNSIAGKLRNKWGQLTDDELQSFNGNVDQLVGMIQKKTGEARSAVEKFLDDVSTNGASAVGQAAETVRKYAHDAADSVQDTTRRAMDQARYGYEEAEGMVRKHPGESIAVCFGVGMLVGVVLGLSLRSR